MGMIDEHWSPRNYTIYRNLEQLAKRSFGLIQEHLSSNVPIPTEEWQWSELVLKKRGEIQKLPEFGDCVKSMLADKEMLAHNDEEIQAFGWGASKYVSKVCILPFLEKLVLQIKSREFDDVAFNNLYVAFENAIYSSVFEYKAWSPLYGFDCRTNHLALARHLRIRVPDVSEDGYEGAFRMRSVTKDSFEYLIPPFIVEMDYSIPKGAVISTEEPNKVFDKVVSALRLFKPGMIGLGPIRANPIYWQRGFPDWRASGAHATVFGGMPYELPAVPYELTEEEARQFVKFYKWLLKVNTSREPALEIATRRFNLAYEREMLEDKLIDIMIGFEALLLRERDELALRLSLRVANLLQDVADKQDVFAIVKKAYEVRSAIVHGGRTKSEKLDLCVRTTEDLLRKSLCTFFRYVEKGQQVRQLIKQLDAAIFT